jgi:hypothetical protein
VKASDVSLAFVSPTTLRIDAHRRNPFNDRGEGEMLVEEVEIPEEVEEHGMEASLEDGMLRITMPKGAREERRGRREDDESGREYRMPQERQQYYPAKAQWRVIKQHGGGPRFGRGREYLSDDEDSMETPVTLRGSQGVRAVSGRHQQSSQGRRGYRNGE